MLGAIRFFIVIAVAAVFGAISWLAPNVFTGKFVSIVLWFPSAILFLGTLFFRNLDTLSADGLSGSEAERLVLRKNEIRRQLFRLAGFTACAYVCLVVLFNLNLVVDKWQIALAAGVLSGGIIQYTVLLCFWVLELSRFKDERDRQKAVNAARDASIKSFKE